MTPYTYTGSEKAKISGLIKELQKKSAFAASNKKFARSIGMTDTDLSILYSGKWKNNRRISDAKWIKLARIAGYVRFGVQKWITANTYVYDYIAKQLTACMHGSLATMLADQAGIGKTHAAKDFARANPTAFYIDCSTVPQKHAFVRKLAATLGIDPNNNADDLIDDIVFVLQHTHTPLLVLDEAGDLAHHALLILKRLYNGLEGACGFYLIGADGLKAKIERGVRWKKLGFAEFFSRFGRGFKKALPATMAERIPIYEQMAAAIAVANGITSNQRIKNIIMPSILEGNTLHDMRKVKRIVMREKREAA